MSTSQGCKFTVMLSPRSWGFDSCSPPVEAPEAKLRLILTMTVDRA